MQQKILFPGSFDPFTIGHANLVERALLLFDQVVIAIGNQEEKRPRYEIEQRLEALNTLYKGNERVSVAHYTGLTLDFAAQIGAAAILRGVRSVKDFEYERDMATLNHQIGGIETVFLLAHPQYAAISSSIVRELLAHGKDVSSLLPKQSTQL